MRTPKKSPAERILYARKSTTYVGIAFFGAMSLLFFAVNKHDSRAAAWVLGIACALIYGSRLIPGMVYLKLTPEGFEYRNWLAPKFVRWEDVHRFTTYVHKFARYVSWAYVPYVSEDGISGFFNRLFYRGNDDGFWVNYEMDANALAALMEQWRKRYSEPIASHTALTEPQVDDLLLLSPSARDAALANRYRSASKFD